MLSCGFSSHISLSVLQLHNQTPFTASLTLFPDERGVDTLYLVVCATFIVEAGRPVRLAEFQRPIRERDEFFGAPGQSSLRYPSEFHLRKPATDVLLLGDAFAGGRPVETLDVSLRVGPLQKTIRVFGDRTFRADGTLSPARPFTRLPLRYEHARGGPDETANPVGIHPRDRLPHLEDPANPLLHPNDRPPPIGFGPLAPTWMPRRQHVGTYDLAWQTLRAPYLPHDFDPRFFCTAPADQILHTPLRGGETIEVLHVWPAPRLRFHLPRCELTTRATIAGRDEPVPLALETVLLEPAERRLDLTWRGALVCDKRIVQIEALDLSLAHLDLGAAP